PFEDLFEANGKRKVAAQPGMSLVQEVASNKLVDGLSKLNVEDKKNLAQLLHPDGKSTDLKPSDYTALSAALSPVLTELQGQKKAGQALTAKAVAQKINHALNEKSKILKVGGIVLSDKAREVLAENMTIALSGSDKLGVEITPDFKKKSETHKQDFIKDVAKKEISQQVQEKIFEKSALMAADAFNEAGLFALGVPGTRKDLELIYKSCTLFETKDKDGKKVFRCEKPRDNLSAVELQAFEAARDRVYKAVAADNRTLNEAQVKIVGDRVAEVAVNTLSDTHGKSVSEALTKAMANAIDEETKGLLDKNETAKGNTVAKINHTNRTHAYNPNPFVESVDGNILGDISAELPKAFSNTEANKPQLQQLAEVQQALKESNNSKIAAITNGAN
ncbi:MAG: hypothetical protein EBX40_08295, partial [Gammaproteobacteria bacterium]|nr:hypothetical protein [Gammaproteobacteria bacterium]